LECKTKNIFTAAKLTALLDWESVMHYSTRSFPRIDT